MGVFGVVILAGGGATRMGGVPKPALPVAGIRLIDRVLAAATPLGPVVVVAPSDLDLSPGVLRTREDPPGAGPVAALSAGVNALSRAGHPVSPPIAATQEPGQTVARPIGGSPESNGGILERHTGPVSTGSDTFTRSGGLASAGGEFLGALTGPVSTGRDISTRSGGLASDGGEFLGALTGPVSTGSDTFTRSGGLVSDGGEFLGALTGPVSTGSDTFTRSGGLVSDGGEFLGALAGPVSTGRDTSTRSGGLVSDGGEPSGALTRPVSTGWDVSETHDRPVSTGRDDPKVRVVASAEGDAADCVVLLGGDLPVVTTDDLLGLVGRLAGHDVAAFVDLDGQPQWMCSVWRLSVLVDRLRTLADQVGGKGPSIRRLAADLRVALVPGDVGDRGLPPWFDCDTQDDLRIAEEWLSR